MTDDELVRRIVQRNPVAFKELVERYQAMVYSVSFNLLHDHQQAEDISQEVFLQVYRSAAKFRFKSKVSSWLYRIAVNRSLNLIRHNRRFRWLQSISSKRAEDEREKSGLSNPLEKSPDLVYEDIERREFIQKAVDSLTAKQRVPFILNKFEGFGNREIAEILRIPLTTVEARLRRAKVNLKNKLISYLDPNNS